MSEANCLIVLDHDRGPVAAGETVEAWPFHGLA
jgi:molybdopterin molybdotransferase